MARIAWGKALPSGSPAYFDGNAVFRPLAGCRERDTMVLDSAMCTLNGLFALITYVAATALMIWGAVLTQVFPWRSRYEAAGAFGAIFSVSLILLVIAWRLVRRQRVEMSVNAPRSWRFADYVLCVEAAIAGLFLIEALLTALP